MPYLVGNKQRLIYESKIILIICVRIRENFAESRKKIAEEKKAEVKLADGKNVLLK